ncbi:A disintegrin and metalloproteinase with thrombospondin motifs 20-like isoform X1 [Erpetoichthys calabaricus]|uniref:A disintegrin and metalloproteinase with thrombospondin motifs 20-like isoform X1 n=1 Tax=Erpetoichthys calabaricus TaxID=27687 RepID=UPI0022346719|nr:A disintegrin and metalloproteinase with thrombospondin motifs 20-like isoform X1 [Erpetoichthys calabaricus]
MQLVSWQAVLLCHLSSLVHISLELRLHPKQANLVKQVSAYEIITPIRVNDFGETFPPMQHFKRRKRSLSSDLWGTRTHYKIDAFGQHFHLNLTADSGFIAPSYSVVHLGAESSKRSDLYKEMSDDIRHCFFKGHVNDKREYTAVFSVCTGLVGTFRIHDSEYFLEPLLKLNGDEYEDEHNKPHLMYRHERKKENTLVQKVVPCGSIDEPIKKQVNLQNDSIIREGIHSFEKALSSEDSSRFVNNTNNKSYSRTRQKRFLSYPRFVEVMVTADTKMVRHHGHNLEHYILTLMSVVAAIYKDPSVGNLINIMVVKLIVVHHEQDGPSINVNAATTLHNFCVWQQTQNVLDDSHPSHHDTAVLITREDICRAANKCDTLGLAELGTMCDPYRSCSISEENGLSASFTIAHELGHVFNMPHDDRIKCKDIGGKQEYHVMAPTLNYNTSPWSWSKCSRKYITEFLDTGYGECLLDEPVSRSYDLPSQLPGQLYNANKQCELMFGPGSQVCPYLKQCKRLWCTSAEGIHKGCRTQHMPLADGTDCGHGMHCRQGLCVNKEIEMRPVDGEWGLWGPYSACSRTCGGGIRSAVRDCNKPEPRNGGKFCVGRRMKFRSCNTESCPKGSKDFREEQCSEFNGIHFNINGLPPSVRWMPKYSGIQIKDRCKLFCRVAGTTAYYQLKDRVVDGTQCEPETHDICVQGLCRQAGCDHVLNSKARKDKCGVCGGDNSSCKTLAGTFSSAQYGYNIVVRIPAGATNIDIRQHSYSGKPEDDNYLALSDSQSNFKLNGNFVVSMFKREIPVQGTVMEYSGSDTNVERINCSGRIEEELILQVLSVGNLHNPDVRYSFNIPIENQKDQFAWDVYGSWQECNKMCQGEKKQKAICIRKNDHLVVSDQRCENLPLPALVTEPCNSDCELRWNVVGKSECSSKCGPGYKTQDIQCMKYSVSKSQSEPVNSRFCGDQSKPPVREACHGDCHLTSWHYSSWSQCSKSCGSGTRTRDSYCMNNLGRRLAERECNEKQRIMTQTCNDFACPEWVTSEWSECLVTCGKGVKHRQIWCSLNEERLTDNLCSSNTKPESVGACELAECASWQVGAWGMCTVTCGHGYQMRAVKCVAGNYGETLDDRECNAAARPRDSQECEMPVCPEIPKVFTTALPGNQRELLTQWRYGSWTPCSVTCGKGKQARYVSCRDTHGGVADESYCAHLPRPPEISTCFSSCGQWHAGEWSSCSVTCGQGRSTRQVICSNYHHQIEEGLCDPDNKPSAEQQCNTTPCPSVYHLVPSNQPAHFPSFNYQNPHMDHSPQDRPHDWNVLAADNQWRTGPWGACSSTCAGGFQRRVVVCQDGEGRTTNYCEERLKPVESKSCDSGPCPRWNYGSWGECTQTCGGGTRTRLVICQLSNGQRLNDNNCEILDKPPDREQCNVHLCPGSVSWQRGPWKSCSVTCGKGIKHREVVCISQGELPAKEEDCKHLAKPRSHKPCRSGRCPSWKANTWKECSVTCGVGVQKRDVFCRIKKVGQVSEALCNPFTRPAIEQQCHSSDCSYFQWITKEWQDCAVACGEGVKTRKVICVDLVMNQVTDSHCSSLPKPPSSQRCKAVPCEYAWITGDWSQCSASCGQGVQQRMVSCSEAHTTVDHYSYDLQLSSYSKCPGPAPPNTQECNLQKCVTSATWEIGQWSKCSVTCGTGEMERKVECLDNKGIPSELCVQNEKPESKATCQNKECDLSTSCSDVQMKQGFTKDGEYLLRIKGKSVQIYCAEMQSEHPKEYVTLRSGQTDNYSEIYGYRLQNPYECPFNGSRRRDCLCRNDYAAAGYTVFYKIRLDVNAMQIITTDLLFTQTLLGRTVPFATAGDCYSAAKCPQGQFSINLTGTGLRVTETTKWMAQGNYATVKVHQSHDGTRIYGRCGGYCGKCIPQTNTGLRVQVQ